MESAELLQGHSSQQQDHYHAVVGNGLVNVDECIAAGLGSNAANMDLTLYLGR
jgi:hypothetical protein